MTTAATKSLVREFHDVVNQRIETDRANEFLAPDFTMHWFPTPGADGVIDFDLEGWLGCVHGVHSAFDHFESLIEDEIAEGDRVVHRFRATGKHVREIPVPVFPAPAGALMQVNGITIYRVQDGRIEEAWESWDLTNFLASMTTA